jgi:hypothetical protein
LTISILVPSGNPKGNYCNNCNNWLLKNIYFTDNKLFPLPFGTECGIFF